MRAALFLAVCMSLAHAAVPEPAGYWLGSPRGDVPASIAGGRVIDTAALAALLAQHAGVLLDVATAARRPANMAAGALWLPLAHQDIPGSVWIPEAGQAAASAAMESYLHNRLASLSSHDLARPIVVYCHSRCWMSWNAAKRVIGYGYKTVYWYPDGVEGWVGAEHSAAPVKPEGPGAANAG